MEERRTLMWVMLLLLARFTVYVRPTKLSMLTGRHSPQASPQAVARLLLGAPARSGSAAPCKASLSPQGSSAAASPVSSSLPRPAHSRQESERRERGDGRVRKRNGQEFLAWPIPIHSQSDSLSIHAQSYRIRLTGQKPVPRFPRRFR